MPRKDPKPKRAPAVQEVVSDSHEACQALRDAGRMDEASEMHRRLSRAAKAARIAARGEDYAP